MPDFTHPRLRREAATLQAMLEIYCQGHHAPVPGELCPDCASLLDYAMQRLERCPFQAGKPACARCTVHCYRKDPRAAVRQVMRYAGPRMLYRHPGLAWQHLLDGLRKPPTLKKR